MSVRYIQFQSVSNLFSPAVRAFGNIAIIGDATTGTANPYEVFTDPDTAEKIFQGTLGTSIALAFSQSPGPTVIYGVRVAAPGFDWTTALSTVSNLNVQLVVLANTPVNANSVAVSTTSGTTTTPAGAIKQLSDHVIAISNEDGKERIGVAMLPKGVTDVSSIIANERMVYIAHKSDQDAAAAVAGTIAGYEPSVSILLKPVNITTGLFSPAEIIAINGSESFGNPPAGNGVNWLTSPSLLPGGGIYMGEGYTGNPGGGKKFIDIVRTIDDISFRLKARLIKSIGALRISRAGLRSLVAQMEAILDPYVTNDILTSYLVAIPLLTMLDKPPESLTPSELQQIHQAQAQRLVQVLVTIEYQAAIHRLALTLKFD